MHDFDLYIFLVVTFGHFASIPLWLKRFAGGEFSSLEEYLFYASFFAVGSFYVVLHFIGLLGGDFPMERGQGPELRFNGIAQPDRPHIGYGCNWQVDLPCLPERHCCRN